jgi:hypothetical protein
MNFYFYRGRSNRYSLIRFCSVCKPRISLDIPARRKSIVLIRLSIICTRSSIFFNWDETCWISVEICCVFIESCRVFIESCRMSVESCLSSLRRSFNWRSKLPNPDWMALIRLSSFCSTYSKRSSDIGG